MRFDTDDLDTIEAWGQLESVILHEMGHVLGLGTLWDGFLQNPSLPGPRGADTHFNGPVAIETFDLVGGIDYTGGEKVPVENEQGSTGTRDAHWRESVFATELMTGFLNGGVTNPLSIVSVGSFGDLGYTFSLAAADPYAPPLAAGVAPATARRLELGDDVWRGPLYVLDARGRILRRVR